ncbi:MAG: hypothetical protein ACYCT3_11210 [Acidiferrobacter sp.]
MAPLISQLLAGVIKERGGIVGGVAGAVPAMGDYGHIGYARHGGVSLLTAIGVNRHCETDQTRVRWWLVSVGSGAPSAF